MSEQCKILATLWLLSNQESFPRVADRFGMSKGTLHDIFIDRNHGDPHSLTTGGLMGEYIFWPSEYEMALLADEVLHSTRFPSN